jgi:hypothetical protein
MLESCTISFASLLLMLFEGLHRDDLLLREQIGMRLDKLEDEAEGQKE